MSQFFVAVNQDKREWIHPHRFGDGLKFLEFSKTASGFLAGLALLLRQSSGSGGGDWNGYLAPADALERYPIVGSWAGDKVAIIGDYDDSYLYREAMDSYRDVSFDIMKAMIKQQHTKKALKAAIAWRVDPRFKDVCCAPEEMVIYEEMFKEPTFQEELSNG